MEFIYYLLLIRHVKIWMCKFLHSSQVLSIWNLNAWMQEWNGGELWCGDVICFIKSHWALWTLIVIKGVLRVQFTLTWDAVSLLLYSFLCFAYLYCLQNVPLYIRLPPVFGANVTEPEETKAQEPRQSHTLCPFLSFLTRLSPLSRLELILCE